MLYDGIEYEAPLDLFMEAYGYYAILIYKGLNIAVTYDTLVNKD